MKWMNHALRGIRWPVCGLLCGLLGGLAMPARADIAVQLVRISDTEARLTVTGALAPALPDSNPHALFLMDPFQTRPAPTASTWVLDESDLHAGSFNFTFANEAGSEVGVNPNRPPGFPAVSGFANTIYLGNSTFVFPLPNPFQPIPAGVPFEGSMLLFLGSGSTFAPVGARGDVHWGITLTQVTLPSGSGFVQQDKGVLSGTWEMVGAPPVPEPGAAALMLAGLGLLGSVAWRHRVGPPAAKL